MTITPALAVGFKEVRHDQPEDPLHHEPLEVRGRLHDWTIPLHRHEALHQFQWLETGCAVLSLDGEDLPLTAPAVFMVAPGTVHGLHYEGACTGHQVTLPSALLVAALGHLPGLGTRLAHSAAAAGPLGPDVVDELRTLFALVAREFGRPRGGRAAALQQLGPLVALAVLRQLADADAARRPAPLRDTLVQRYRLLLEQHFRQHHPVSHYADQLQVSADHLSRSCRAVTGQSALELMHERQLLEARRLLRYTAAPVAHVAQSLGFEDAGYFSRFFTRRTGLSPRAFRALPPAAMPLPTAAPDAQRANGQGTD